MKLFVLKSLAALALLAATGFAAQVALTGQVTFHDGSPAVGAPVCVMLPTGAVYANADSLGNYSFSVEEGTCNYIDIHTMGEEIAGLPSSFTYVAHQEFQVSGNMVKDIQLPQFHRISGVLQSPSGNPVPGVTVRSSRYEFGMTNDPGDESDTDSLGLYELFCYPGSVLVRAPTVSDSGFAAFSDTLDVTGDISVTLAYPVNPVLSGTVLGYDGDTIRNIEVNIQQDGMYQRTYSDSLGSFAFTVSSGTVASLGVMTMNDTLSAVPANFSFNAATDIQVTADTTIDIVLPNLPVLLGTVEDEQGNPIEGAQLSSARWSGSMTNEPSDDDFSDASGAFRLVCSEGDNQIEIQAPESSVYSGTVLYYTLSADSTATIVLPRGMVVEGKVVFSDSTTPVVDIEVAMSGGGDRSMTRTDGNGAFRFVTAAGYYNSLEAFTMSTEVAGVPSYLYSYAFQESTLIDDSTYWLIVLPELHRVSGTILNSNLDPVEWVTVSAATWLNGESHEPRDEHQTSSDGTYELFVIAGPNYVEVRPQLPTIYAISTFMLDVDSAMTKDIILTDQAKGIARVQPSVISQGKEGKVTLTGVNTQFTGGVDTVDLGAGVNVSDITVYSDISLTAMVSIDSSAVTGVRSVRAVTASETYVGSEIFTVTAPSSVEISLDGDGRLLEDVVVGDGTGTELAIDSGTVVSLPPGADTVLSFDAPIISNDSIHPSNAEFLQVQREFFPEGVEFYPPAELTFHYQEQDIQDIVDETELMAFKYDNETDSVIGEYTIIARDTANNSLVQEVTTFSLFRLAESMASRPGRAPRRPTAVVPVLSVAAVSAAMVEVSYVVPKGNARRAVALDVFDARGRKLVTLLRTEQGPGTYRLRWSLATPRGRPLGRGMYWVELAVGEKRFRQKLLLGR